MMGRGPVFASRIVKRGLRLERWRIVAWYRRYHGHGSPVFEFEFRLGRPRPYKPFPIESLLDDDDLAVMALDADGAANSHARPGDAG